MAKIVVTIEAEGPADLAATFVALGNLYGEIQYDENDAPVQVPAAGVPAPVRRGGRPRKAAPEAPSNPPADASPATAPSLLPDTTPESSSGTSDPGPTATTAASPSSGGPLTPEILKQKMAAALEASTPLGVQGKLKEKFGENCGNFTSIPQDRWPEAAELFDNIVAGAALTA